MNSEPSPSPTRRATLHALIAGSPLALSGCLTVEDLDNIQADWDQKHPEGTGIQGIGLPKMLTVLATYEATKTQRAAAEQRAQQAFKKMLRQKSRHVTASSKPKAASTSSAVIFNGRTGEKVATTRSKAETIKKVAEIAKKIEPDPAVPLPPRAAVPVPSDNRLVGKSTVMALSTSTQQIVGNRVYDLSQKPKTGALAVLDGHATEFVGN